MRSLRHPADRSPDGSLRAGFIFGRIVLAVWLVGSAGFALGGWRERTAGQVPLVPIGELPQHVGQRVRVRGSMLDPWLPLPNGYLVALQAVRVTTLGSTESDRAAGSYVHVWPRELWLGNDRARVRVETQGLAPQYVRQVVEGYTTNAGMAREVANWLLPELHRRILPQLRIPNSHVTVHAIWRSEEVSVVGLISVEDGQPVIRSGRAMAPLIVTTMPPSVFNQASRFAGSWQFAAGVGLFLLGVTIWLWLRAGFGQTIRGVEIYPLVVAATREARARGEVKQRIDQRLAEAGVDVREYREQRRANNRRALLRVLAASVLAIVLGTQLGGKPVSVSQAGSESPPTARPPTPRSSAAAPGAMAPRMLTFSSDSARVPPAVRRIFVRFTLARPTHWLVFQQRGRGAPTFYCSFARRNAQGLIVESIEVSWQDSEAVTSVDRQSLAALRGQMERERRSNFLAAPTDRKLYERPTELGGMPAYEAAFEHLNQSDLAGSYTVFWKLVLIPAANGPRRGLVVSFAANTLAPEIRSIEDLGTRGELPLILGSLRVLR